MHPKTTFLLAMLFTLSACGGDSKNGDANNNTTEAPDQSAEVTENKSDEVKKSSEMADGLYNVDEFELRGIGFGSTPDEARAALAEFYSIDSSEITNKFMQEPFKSEGLEVTVWELDYESDGYEISVYFRPDREDKDIGYMTMKSIRINKRAENRDDSTAYQQVILDEAIEKYGPPTAKVTKSDNNWQYYWCSEKHAELEKCAHGAAALQISDDSIYMERSQ